MQTITVRPLGKDSWVVQHELTEPVLFRSGAKAEDAARRLAARLASVDQGAEVSIHLRDGRVTSLR